MNDAKEYLVVLDTETSGLSPQNDWILQLSAIKVRKKDWKVMGTFNEYILPSFPDYVISQAAQETHHLTKEFISKHGKSLKTVGPAFLEFIKGCDVAGFNSNKFDILFLHKDFRVNGLEFPFEGIRHYDAYSIQVSLMPNRLSDLFYRYTGKTMEEANLEAHNALSDVKATAVVMKCQMEKFNLSWEDLDAMEENNILVPDGTIKKASKPDEPELIVMAVGKYKDRDIYDIMITDPDYLRWARDKLFSSYTLKLVREYCVRRQQSATKK